MKRNELIDKLVNEGLSEKTLSKLTDNQINILYDHGNKMHKINYYDILQIAKNTINTYCLNLLMSNSDMRVQLNNYIEINAKSFSTEKYSNQPNRRHYDDDNILYENDI